jgi:hypothetical protein
MIKQLHSKNANSRPNVEKKLNRNMPAQQMLQELSADLMQPRHQAIVHILAKATAMKMV